MNLATDTTIALGAQALCLISLLAGPVQFATAVAVSFLLMDVRLYFEDPVMIPIRVVGTSALILWAGWVGYAARLEDSEPWKAGVYSLTVLFTSYLSIKQPSKRRIFFVVAVIEAFMMVHTQPPDWAFVLQSISYMFFAHVLLFGRLAQQENPSLLWIMVSSVWVLLCPWFVALPLMCMASAVILPRARDAWRRVEDEMPGDEEAAPVLNPTN